MGLSVYPDNLEGSGGGEYLYAEPLHTRDFLMSYSMNLRKQVMYVLLHMVK